MLVIFRIPCSGCTRRRPRRAEPEICTQGGGRDRGATESLCPEVRGPGESRQEGPKKTGSARPALPVLSRLGTAEVPLVLVLVVVRRYARWLFALERIGPVVLRHDARDIHHQVALVQVD